MCHQAKRVSLPVLQNLRPKRSSQRKTNLRCVIDPTNISLSVVLVTFFAIFLSHCGEECGRTGFLPAVLPGFSSLRPSSFIASESSFLQIRQSPRTVFGFAETCSLGISADRFDMCLSRQNTNTTHKLQECV